MFFVVLVLNVLAIAVHHTERATEIPEREAPAGLLPEGQAVSRPRERHVMRCLVVTAPLTHVDLNASINQRLVRIDVFALESRAVPGRTAVVFHRPGRSIETFKFIFRHPGRRVVTDGFGQVAARALDQAQVRDVHHRRLTDIDAVGEDQTVGIDFANGSDLANARQ